MNNSRAYVLITPVKDEEALIGETIASVIGQSFLPLQWVIVSDGSKDRTEEIVRSASIRQPWIRLICLPSRVERSFAAVVHTTEIGVRALDVTDYKYVGLLDSDVRFGPDYFKKIIQKFEALPHLGLGGGMVVDLGDPKDRLPRNRQDVPGAAQFFRRQCFEELGGLFAIPGGGWDMLTCVRARMLGYETRLFTDIVMDHLKPRNIAEGGLLRRKWQMGVRDYGIGYHLGYEFFKCMSRFMEPPAFIGAIVRMTGYCAAGQARCKRIIPDDMIQFIQDEQLKRLKRWLLGHPAVLLFLTALAAPTSANKFL